MLSEHILFLMSNINVYHYKSQSSHTHIHMGAALYVMFMHIDAKKSMNYILTLHMYKTFLILEKSIPLFLEDVRIILKLH